MKLSKPFQILNEKEIIQIIENAVSLLQKNGCRMEYLQACDALAQYGCDVAKAQRTVKFPPNVLAEAFKKVTPYQNVDTPSVLLIGACRPRIWDYTRKSRREGSLEDAKNIIKLFNELPYIALASAGIFPSLDVPKDAVDVVNTSILCQYSKKAFLQDIYSLDSAKIILKMLPIHEEGEERKMFGKLHSFSPLGYKEASLELATIWSQSRQPLFINSSPCLGKDIQMDYTTALSVITAEWIAGIVYLASISHPAGVVLQSIPSLSSARYNTICFSPEQAKLSLALQQIGRYLGYPCMTASWASNVSWWDMQTGWEKSISGALGWASGSMFSGYAGLIGEDFSPEQLVLDNFAALLLHQLALGISITEETMDFEKLQGYLTQKLKTESKETEDSLTILATDSSKKMEASARANQFVNTIYAKESSKPLLSEDKVKELERLVQIRLKQLGG